MYAAPFPGVGETSAGMADNVAKPGRALQESGRAFSGGRRREAPLRRPVGLVGRAGPGAAAGPAEEARAGPRPVPAGAVRGSAEQGEAGGGRAEEPGLGGGQ